MNLTTTLFEAEGRDNVDETIDIVSRACSELKIGLVIIFAASASNVLRLRERLPESVSIVAVTFPAQFTATVAGERVYAGIHLAEDFKALSNERVAVVRGVMPFRGTSDYESPLIKGVRGALNLFGGGLQLCVQATLMACDSGYVNEGERCIVMSADTALVVRAGHAYRFLSEASAFAIEHVLCKPVNYQITKAPLSQFVPAATAIDVPAAQLSPTKRSRRKKSAP